MDAPPAGEGAPWASIQRGDTALARPIKYPRTCHLPHSPGMTSDDRVIASLDHLQSGPLVVTEKMDGGNYTMTRDHSYARSTTSASHSWDTHARRLWGAIRHDIPEGWRVTGESLHAQRSVRYQDLDSPFLAFGVWNEEGNLVDWDTTEEWAQLLGVSMVPVLYRGDDFAEANRAWAASGREADDSEGYVVRRADAILTNEFPLKVAKYVRADHVRTDSGWRHRNDYPVNGYRR